MTTTRANRTKPTTTYSLRDRPVLYLSNLQDVDGVVEDHLWQIIEVFWDTGTPYWTQRSQRTPV